MFRGALTGILGRLYSVSFPRITVIILSGITAHMFLPPSLHVSAQVWHENTLLSLLSQRYSTVRRKYSKQHWRVFFGIIEANYRQLKKCADTIMDIILEKLRASRKTAPPNASVIWFMFINSLAYWNWPEMANVITLIKKVLKPSLLAKLNL